MTDYIHRVTIAVPEPLMEKTNHLACIVGESAADINTFTFCGWHDIPTNCRQFYMKRCIIETIYGAGVINSV